MSQPNEDRPAVQPDHEPSADQQPAATSHLSGALLDEPAAEDPTSNVVSAQKTPLDGEHQDHQNDDPETAEPNHVYPGTPNNEKSSKDIDTGKSSDHADAIRMLRKRMRKLERQLRHNDIHISRSLSDNPKSSPNDDERSVSDKDESSSDVKDDETDEETELDQLDDPGRSIKLLQERIEDFEEQLKEKGILPVYSTDPGPDRLPAIPKLHRVDWTNFKNKYVEVKQKYAIEVLVGEAKYFYQRANEGKSKQPLEDNREQESDHEEKPPRDVFSSPHTVRELPERIRINSVPIIENLVDIDTAGIFGAGSTVMIRPFKPLVYYENAIRQRYESLKDKWGALDADMSSKPTNSVTLQSGGIGVRSSPFPDPAHDKLPSTGEDNAETNGLEPFDQPTHASTAIHGPAQPDDSGPEPGTDNGNAIEAAKQRSQAVDLADVKTNGAAFDGEAEIDRNLKEPTSKSVNEVPSGKGIPSNDDLHVATKSSSEAKLGKANREDQKKKTKKKKKKETLADLVDTVEAFRDFRCLIEFMDEELKPVMDALKLNTQTKIAFSNLWFIFKPGELAIAPLGSKSAGEIGVEMGGTLYPRRPTDRFQEAWRVYSTANGRPNLVAKGAITPDFTSTEDWVNTFDVATYHVDYIGSRFVTRTFRFSLRPFQGEKAITSLDVYPVRFAPNAEQKTLKWESRGKSFLQYTTFQQRYYKGKSLICHPSGLHRDKDEFPKHAENIDSQVVVDFNEALDANPGWTPVPNLPDAPEMAPREFQEDYDLKFWADRDQKIRSRSENEWFHHDRYIDTKMLEDYRLIDEMIKDFPDASLSEEGKFDNRHLVLLPNRVFAFVLRNRKFALLTVDGLRPIHRYLEGFNDLQLPSDHKQTVKSLVYNHFANKTADSQDLDASHDADLVRGKGNGLIVLLHGAPGVGKTSTAECVAEAFGRLLFPITCGDLGLVAEDVESELSEKFHLAELWDCVLLLDEADVFLARRTNTDVKRNSLVSVFLRMLEYFTGILFLTTNRVGAFDEAFKSRIHISLYYPPLDWPQTDKIWKMNLRRLKEKKKRRHETLHVDEEDILSYAYDHFQYTLKKNVNWNGRQIKNAVQTATALAEYDAQQKTDKATVEYKNQLKEAGGDKSELGSSPTVTDPVLRVSHFKKVAGASFEFDRYISATKGFTDAEFAYQNMERADHIRNDGGGAQQREQQQVPMYMPPEKANPASGGYYPRAPRQPIRQLTQAPAPDNPQFYTHSPQVFASEPSHDLERMASDHTGMGARPGPQSMQQYPPPQSVSALRSQERPGLQNAPRASIGNMQSYYESTQIHPSEITHRQAEQSEYAMRFQDAPQMPAKVVSWDTERSNPAEAFERRRSPQRQEQVQQRQLSPQRQEAFQRQFSPQQQQQPQFRGGPSDDMGSIFG